MDEDARTLERILSERWSCRAFTSEPVPDSTIEHLLDIARRSPSWCNTQPWHVIVTSNTATERFRTALTREVREHGPQSSSPDFVMPLQYTGVHQERRREQGWQLYEAVGVQRGDREASGRQAMKNFELFGAPHVAIVTAPAELADYGAVDAGIYVGTFLLAAQSLGIAAVAQASVARFSPFVRRHFTIPDDRRVVVAISFGYPDQDEAVNSYRTSRADIDATSTWVAS